MNKEQRGEKILQVMIDVLEEGLDTDYHIDSATQHGLVSNDFKSMTRSDFLYLKNHPLFMDIFDRFCKYISDDLTEFEKNEED